MQNYCTLFDSKYLSRGLLMIESLRRVSPQATVYVLCMDEPTKRYLTETPPDGVVTIGLDEFETAALLATKQGRTKAEYCWTCTPAIILHCISKYNLAGCTYADADLYFYRDPAIIFERMGANSVLLTPHRFSADCDRTATSGIYCVQFMAFRATEAGLLALTWWRDRCLEWCFARAEGGKFGDQKYLDDWTARFSGVYVAGEADVGLAPWSIQHYQVDARVFAKSGLLRMGQETISPVFYHFHGIKFWRNGLIDFGTNYRINRGAPEAIYRPYIDELVARNDTLATTSAGLHAAMYEGPYRNRRILLKKILWTLRGTRNIFETKPIA